MAAAGGAPARRGPEGAAAGESPVAPPRSGAGAAPGGSSARSPNNPAAPAPPSAAALDCRPAEGELPALQLTEIATGLAQPTFSTAAPSDDSRLFVLERSGAIRIVQNGLLLPEPFLNLSARVATSNEEGLIGLAFHPRYQENGRLFVQYASSDPAASGDDHEIVLSEFSRSPANPNQADPTSERRLMIARQPASLHLGGMLAFGPSDGMLYMSRGDGGSNDAQDLESWLGKILRIDVEPAANAPYGIPPGNMAGAGVLPEIWSLGLRNPWRFSFDGCTGDMYIGDVGESTFEEINVEPPHTPGRNYGWDIVEGTKCVGSNQACGPSTFIPPTFQYDHGDFGCAVISGYVYRGGRIPGLRGTFLYADYCTGNFGGFRLQAGQVVDARDLTRDLNPDGTLSLISSFGVDNAGEMYVASQRGGLYRIDPE